jgi:hypothetical protein
MKNGGAADAVVVGRVSRRTSDGPFEAKGAQMRQELDVQQTQAHEPVSFRRNVGPAAVIPLTVTTTLYGTAVAVTLPLHSG